MFTAVSLDQTLVLCVLGAVDTSRHLSDGLSGKRYSTPLTSTYRRGRGEMVGTLKKSALAVLPLLLLLLPKVFISLRGLRDLAFSHELGRTA